MRYSDKKKMWKDFAIPSALQASQQSLSMEAGLKTNHIYLNLESVGVPNEKNSYEIKALSEKP